MNHARSRDRMLLERAKKLYPQFTPSHVSFTKENDYVPEEATQVYVHLQTNSDGSRFRQVINMPVSELIEVAL